MIYTLISNDGHRIQFCEHQLELLEFAKSALTDSLNNWIDSKNVELPVPGLNRKTLIQVYDWATIAERVPYDERRFRRANMVRTKSVIMKNGRESTGYNFTYIPPILDETTKWIAEDTGVAVPLLEWADKVRASLTISELFELMDGAHFIGAKDMLELLTGHMAWEMIQGRELIYTEADKMKICKYEFTPTVKKLEYFKSWLGSDDNISEKHSELKSFFREVRENFKRWPYLRTRVLRYQNHSGLPVPRETWSDANWNEFKELARAYYLTLPNEIEIL